MNGNLFKDIYRLINSSSLSEEQFFNYLIGYNNLIELHNFSYNHKDFVSEKKLLQSTFNSSYIKILEQNKALRINDINEYLSRTDSSFTQRLLDNRTEIISLYKKHDITIPSNANTEQLLLHLFTVCIDEKPIFLFASYKKNFLKTATLHNTLGRDIDKENLKKTLEHHKHIVLSGELGCGKTRFIEYCLSKWDLDDCYYVCYEGNLNSTLKRIKFRYSSKTEFSEISFSRLRDSDYSNTLLVIDNMQFSNNMSSDLEQLSSFAIKIIVITTGAINSDYFFNFKLPPLASSDICEVFKTQSGMTLSEVQMNDLYTVSENNVLLVSFIAGQCKSIYNRTNSSISQSDILDNVLTRLKTLDNRTNLGGDINYKYKHTYDNKSISLIGHMKLVYLSHYPYIENEILQYLKYLCCFGCSSIPISFIKEILPELLCEKKRIMDELIAMSLLKSNNYSVQISPLLVHAVIAAENPTPKDMVNVVIRLCMFLQNFSNTLSVPYLSDILLIFAKTLYNNVLDKHNPKQYKTSSNFEKWQQLLYLIYYYYQNCGAYELAYKVNELIRYPADLHNKHNSLDKSFFRLNTNMQLQIDESEIISQINKLIHSLPRNISSLEIANFLTNSFDIALYRFCMLAFSSLETPQQTSSYRNNLVLTMGCLLKYILSTEKETTINLTTEQLAFYNGCYWLITKDTLTIDDFNESLSMIGNWENKNNYLRGYALILYIQCYYCLFNYDFTLFTKSILPNLDKLYDNIKDCHLIPLHTFYLCFCTYISAAIINSASEKYLKHVAPLPITRYISLLLERCIYDPNELNEINNAIKSTFDKMPVN